MKVGGYPWLKFFVGVLLLAADIAEKIGFTFGVQNN